MEGAMPGVSAMLVVRKRHALPPSFFGRQTRFV